MVLTSIQIGLAVANRGRAWDEPAMGAKSIEGSFQWLRMCNEAIENPLGANSHRQETPLRIRRAAASIAGTLALTVLASPGLLLAPGVAHAADGEADAIANATADVVPTLNPAPPGVADNPDTHGFSSAIGSEAGLVTRTVDATAAAPNPYGCYGQTDQPHLSATPGYVNVHARTRCAVNVGYLEAYTELYRGRWYGPQFLNSGDSRREFSYTSGDAVAPWHCAGVGTYTYEGDSAHEVTDGANRYYAYTYNYKRLTC